MRFILMCLLNFDFASFEFEISARPEWIEMQTQADLSINSFFSLLFQYWSMLGRDVEKNPPEKGEWMKLTMKLTIRNNYVPL